MAEEENLSLFHPQFPLLLLFHQVQMHRILLFNLLQLEARPVVLNRQQKEVEEYFLLAAQSVE
jgi:hypothetical protein